MKRERTAAELRAIERGPFLLGVLAERAYQREIWAGDDPAIPEFGLILAEEYGEACQAMADCYWLSRSDEHIAAARSELIQLAAVAMRIADAIVGRERPYFIDQPDPVVLTHAQTRHLYDVLMAANKTAAARELLGLIGTAS